MVNVELLKQAADALPNNIGSGSYFHSATHNMGAADLAVAIRDRPCCALGHLLSWAYRTQDLSAAARALPWMHPNDSLPYAIYTDPRAFLRAIYGLTATDIDECILINDTKAPTKRRRAVHKALMHIIATARRLGTTQG